MYYLPIVLMAIDGFTCMQVFVSISIKAMNHSGTQCALQVLHKETLHLFSMCQHLRSLSFSFQQTYQQKYVQLQTCLICMCPFKVLLASKSGDSSVDC